MRYFLSVLLIFLPTLANGVDYDVFPDPPAVELAYNLTPDVDDLRRVATDAAPDLAWLQPPDIPTDAPQIPPAARTSPVSYAIDLAALGCRGGRCATSGKSRAAVAAPARAVAKTGKGIRAGIRAIGRGFAKLRPKNRRN